MSQFYEGKTERSSKETLLLADKECEKGQSVRKAASLFNMDKMTLYWYIKKQNNLELEEKISVNLGDFVIAKISRFTVRLCINYHLVFS